MAVVVRGYRPGDLAACRRLWEALTERHRLIYDDPTIGGDDAGRYFDKHLEHVGPENIWVAEADGAVIGMTGLIVGDGEAEVEPVVVDEAHRGRGVGARLIAAPLAKAKALDLAYLNIGPVARNSEAAAMFIRSGFGVIGHVQFFIELKGRAPDQPARSPKRSPGEIAELLAVLKAWS